MWIWIRSCCIQLKNIAKGLKSIYLSIVHSKVRRSTSRARSGTSQVHGLSWASHGKFLAGHSTFRASHGISGARRHGISWATCGWA